MGRYVLCRANELTGFVLNFAPSSLSTNMYPKLKKIHRREVAKSWDSKLIQTEKKTQVLLMNRIYLGDSRKGNSQQKFE